MKRTVEDIRSLIDPQGYLGALEEGAGLLKRRLAQLFVDYDLTKDSPSLAAETRAEQLGNLGTVIEDVAWRIEEIDNRIEAAKDGAMGKPNRSDRRRAKRSTKKASKRSTKKP